MEKLAELLKDKAVTEELMRQETVEDAKKFLAFSGDTTLLPVFDSSSFLATAATVPPS